MREAVARAICREACLLPECPMCIEGECQLVEAFLDEADAAIAEIRIHAQVFMRPVKKKLKKSKRS